MLSLREAVASTCAVSRTASPYPNANLIELRGDGSMCTVLGFDGLRTVVSSAPSAFSGVAVVEGKRLEKALSGLGETATVSLQKDRLVLNGAGKVTLAVAAQCEFPARPVAAGVKVNGPAFRAAIQRVSHAMLIDPTRDQLHCIRVEPTGRVIATDMHRLSFAPAPDGVDLTIPGQVVPLLLSMVGDAITVDTSKAGKLVLSDGGVTIATPLTGAQFPPYMRIVPGPGKNLCSVDRKELLNAIRIASLIESTDLVLTYEDGALVLTSEHGTADSVVRVACDGRLGARVNTNPKYVLDAVNACSGDRVTFDIAKELEPMVITGSDESRDVACFLVAPMHDMPGKNKDKKAGKK